MKDTAWKILVAFMFLSCCDGSKLLLILMDGLKYDFDKPGLHVPGFKKFFNEGVRAEYLISDFPTLSYPNYYSLMTGLHVENHGMISNYMYNQDYNQTFLIGTNPEQYNSHWWDGAEPLWVNAENHGLKTYWYYWPGCEVTIRGVNVTFCEKYNLTLIPHFKYSIKSTLEAFENDADVVGIYLEAPDNYGHLYGDNSVKLNKMIEEIDVELNNILGNLSSEGLDTDLNIMIFSDHGMANITDVIDFRNEINFDDIHFILPEDTLINIWPKDGKLEKVYQELVALGKPHVTVYKKEDIPEKFHYKNNKLVPPIIITPDVGYTMCTDKNPHKCPKDRLKGHHGYNNMAVEMRASFMAKGPAFKKNYVGRAIENVQLYQIMCSILGLPAQPNNGTWESIADMMVPTSSTSRRELSLSMSFLLNFILLLFFCN